MSSNDLHTGRKQWVTEPTEIAEGVIAARMLSDEDALNTTVRVVNLSDQPYVFHEDQPLCQALPVEICMSARFL